MLKISTIVLGLSFCHLCLAIIPGEQQREVPKYVQEYYGPRPARQEKERIPLLREESVERPGTMNNPGDKFQRKARLLTVDAAMAESHGSKKNLYLFTGNQVQVLVDGKFAEERPRQEFHVPKDMHLQAAYITPESQDKRIFYGDEYGKFVSLMDDIKERKLKYGPARAFIRDGGPDAAGRRAGKVYVFKGCQVAIRNDWDDWGEPVNVATIGLPCDICAAWNEGDDMVILKGEEIWRWKADDTVEGPDPFSKFYALKTGDTLTSTCNVVQRPPQPPETQAAMDSSFDYH